MLMKTALSLASPAGERARLSVLVFHRVLPEPDPLFPAEMHASRFDALCGWLRDWFKVLPMDEAVQRLKTGTLPARALGITFDDGYADNHDVALPILRRHGLNATFFIATDFLDGGRMWNDTVIETVRRTPDAQIRFRDWEPLASATFPEKVAAIDNIIGRTKYLPVAERQQLTEELAEAAHARLPDDLMMSSQQVQALHTAGMRIGAHTMSHPILATMSTEQARREIDGGRAILQDLIGERLSLFAYPNGKRGDDYTDDTVALLRELGFDAAVTTQWGASRRQTDLLQMPRFSPWDRSRWRYGARMLDNLVRERGGGGY